MSVGALMIVLGAIAPNPDTTAAPLPAAEPLAVKPPPWGSQWGWHTAVPEAPVRFTVPVVQQEEDDVDLTVLLVSAATIGVLMGWNFYSECKEDPEACADGSPAKTFLVGFGLGALLGGVIAVAMDQG